MTAPALDLRDLSVTFPGAAAPAVDHVSLRIEPGEAVGIVGESGSGKSMLGFALTRLTPAEAIVSAKSLHIAGADLTRPTAEQLAAVRGRSVTYIFQEPLSALSPTRRLGDQMADVLRTHARVDRNQALAQAQALLADVHVDDPAQALKLYPHQLSGGMRQRALIALAFANQPALIVADEVTTAIDAAVRGAVLDLMARKAKATGAAIMFISHDLGVVRSFCRRVAVMYRGRIVETGDSEAVTAAPLHPYTQMLVAALPDRSAPRTPLPIGGHEGQPTIDAGCAYRARCAQAAPGCEAPQILRESQLGRFVRCVRA